MCKVIPCGCGETTVGGSIFSFVIGGALIAAAVTAAVGPTAAVAGGAAVLVAGAMMFGPTRRALWWITRKALAPAVAMLAVVAAMWVAGQAFTPRSRERRERSRATWLRNGPNLVDPKARLGIHWYAWAGWQRTVVRLVLAGVVTAAWLAPLITALILASVALAIASRIAVTRFRAGRVAGDVDDILRVKSVTGYALPTARRAVAADTNPVDAEIVEEPASTHMGVTA